MTPDQRAMLEKQFLERRLLESAGASVKSALLVMALQVDGDRV